MTTCRHLIGERTPEFPGSLRQSDVSIGMAAPGMADLRNGASRNGGSNPNPGMAAPEWRTPGMAGRYLVFLAAEHVAVTATLPDNVDERVTALVV